MAGTGRALSPSEGSTISHGFVSAFSIASFQPSCCRSPFNSCPYYKSDMVFHGNCDWQREEKLHLFGRSKD